MQLIWEKAGKVWWSHTGSSHFTSTQEYASKQCFFTFLSSFLLCTHLNKLLRLKGVAEEMFASPFTEIPKPIINFDALLKVLVALCRQCTGCLCLPAMITEAYQQTDLKNIHCVGFAHKKERSLQHNKDNIITMLLDAILFFYHLLFFSHLNSSRMFYILLIFPHALERVSIEHWQCSIPKELRLFSWRWNYARFSQKKR